MDFEYFTVGGGWYLYNFFNAVAAIAQSQAFRDAVLAASVVGGGWLTLNIAFEQRWNSTGTWLATLAVVLYGFTAPVSTVKITDTISHAESSGYTVSNVPFGLAFFGSITNNAGKLMTDLFEQNFADPDSPLLQEHGFLFGARLLTDATRMEITDSNFSNSFSSYIRNCVFYDLLQGRKNIEGLKVAADPFEWIIDDPHQARMFEFSQVNGTEVDTTLLTCASGTDEIRRGMTGAVTDAEGRLAAGASTTNTTRSRAAIQGIVVSDLGDFHNYLIGTSRTAQQILQRQITINSLLRGPAEWLGETGNDAAMKDYIDARLQLQTRQSYGSVGRQAEKWVPILKATFQCVYIAIFPFAILLMVTPIGGTIIRNYLIGLVWIESWGPLFSILNYMMNSAAQTQMQSVLAATGTDTDISLFAQAGIQEVHADIAVQAGGLAASVPFISLALAAGVGRFAYLASSTLAVSQEAVADTTRESATGQLAIGNTSYDNHSAGNYGANQFNDSPYFDSGRSTAYADDGSLLRDQKGGDSYIDEKSAISPLGTDRQFTNDIRSSISQGLTRSEAELETAGTNLDKSVAVLEAHSQGFINTISENRGEDIKYANNDNAQETQDLKTVESVAETLSEKHGISEREATRIALSASLGFGEDGFGASAKTEYNNQADKTAAWEDAVNATNSQEFSEAAQRLTSAQSTESASWATNVGDSYSEGHEARLTETETLQESYNTALQTRNEFQEAQQLVEGAAWTESTNHNQDYVDFLKEELGYNTSEINDFLKSDELNDVNKRQALETQFRDSVIEDVFEEIRSPDFQSNQDERVDALNERTNIPGVYTATQEDIPDGAAVQTRTDERGLEIRDGVEQKLDDTEQKIVLGREDTSGTITGQAAVTETQLGQSTTGIVANNTLGAVDAAITTGAELAVDAGTATKAAVEEHSTTASQTSAAGQFGPGSVGFTHKTEPEPSIIDDDPALANNANTNTHKGSGDTALSDDPTSTPSPHSIPAGDANPTVVDTTPNTDGQAVTNQDNIPEASATPATSEEASTPNNEGAPVVPSQNITPQETAPVDTTEGDSTPNNDGTPVVPSQNITPQETAPVDTTEGASTPNNDGTPVVPSQNITSQDTAPVDTTEGASTPNNDGAPVVPSQNITPQETAPVDTTEGDSTPNNDGTPVVPSQNITPQETAPVDTTEGASTPNNDGAPVAPNPGITPTPEGDARASDDAPANNTTSGLINPETLGSTKEDYVPLDTNLGDDKKSSKGKSDASEEDNKDDAPATGGHGQGNEKPKDWK